MKKSCINCHFFVTHTRADNGRELTFEISSKKREACMKDDFSWQREHESIACDHTVWDEGYKLSATKHNLVVKQERDDSCFFWKYTPGMLQPAAKTLQKRAAEMQKASKDKRLTLIGLWIAALALLLNVILQIFKELHWWPFCK